MQRFAVFFRPGPRWDQQRPLAEQDGIAEHPAFLARQFTAGALVMGGPFTDGSGGMSIFEFRDRAALDVALATDESIASGLLVPDVHEWIAGFDRYRGDA
jgi:uncharacterized protein YciI